MGGRKRRDLNVEILEGFGLKKCLIKLCQIELRIKRGMVDADWMNNNRAVIVMKGSPWSSREETRMRDKRDRRINLAVYPIVRPRIRGRIGGLGRERIEGRKGIRRTRGLNGSGRGGISKRITIVTIPGRIRIRRFIRGRNRGSNRCSPIGGMGIHR